MRQIILTIASLLAVTSMMAGDRFNIVAEHGTVTTTVEESVGSLTVTPDDGYYIRMTDIIVEKMLNPEYAQARTRAGEPGVSETLQLSGSDPEDLSTARTYSFTMPDNIYIVKVTARFQTRTLITSDNVKLEKDTYIYDDQVKEPKVTIEGLEEKTDFTVAYSNNREAGTAVVTITGRSTYKGVVEVPFTIKPKIVDSPTITLSQTEYTYDGEAKEPSVTVNDGETVILPDEYTVDYSDNTNAGTATVSIKDKEGGNYTVSGTVTFTIDKAESEVTTAPEAKTLTYTGEEQELVTAGTAEGGEMQYSLDGENYSTDVPSATDAGTYTVYYRVVGDENHEDIAPVSFSVVINTDDAAMTAPTVRTGLVYTGEEQELVTAGTAEGGEMQYSLDGENYTTDIPTAIDAGTYTVYYRTVGDENHEDVAPASLTVTIAKAKAAVKTAPEAKTLTYTGEAQELVTAGTSEGGEMQYSLDGENYSTDVPTATDAGTYTVYYRVVGDENHEDIAPVSFSVVINTDDAAMTAPTVKTGLVYTGEAQELVTAGSTEGGEMQYSLDGENYSTDVPTATDAGTYTVYYRVVGDKNHEDVAPVSLTVTIAKAKAAVKTAPEAKTLTYMGEAQELVTAGSTEDGEMQYSLDGENYTIDVPTATDAGTYTVYYRVVGDENHEDIAPVSLTVTIENNITVPEFVAPIALELTYTGSEQKLVVAGTAEGGEMQYSLDGENFSKVIPRATDAGNYTVYYYVKGDDNHYDTSVESLTVTISKAEAAIEKVPAAKTLTYNGTAQTLVTAGEVTGGELWYSLDGTDYSTDLPTATEAGTYTVYYKVVGDANHTDLTAATLTVYVAKEGDPTFVAPTAAVLTYTGSAQSLVTAGTTDGGEMQYSLDNETYSTNVPTALAPGSYTVYYRVKGDNNYSDIGPLQLTVTIGKAPLTVTADHQSITYGEALPTLTCSYSGFVGEEDVNVLSAQPTLSTTATADSEVGVYEIYVSGAEAANYDITYVNGKLSINPTFTNEESGETVAAELIEDEEGNVTVAITELPEGFFDGTGTTTLPESLSGSNGVTYPVTQVAAEAFDEMPKGTVVTLPPGMSTTEPVPNVINGDGTCSVLDLTNVNSFETTQTLTVDVVIYERPVVTERQTLCLPYRFRLEEGMTAFTLGGDNNGNAKFEPITQGELEAYKPYIVDVELSTSARRRADGVLVLDLGATNVVIDPTKPDEYVEKGMLKLYGTVHGLTHQEGQELQAFIMQPDYTWRMTASAEAADANEIYLPAFHAYLCFTGETPVTDIPSEFNEVTGISVINAEKPERTYDGVYDLSGRKVQPQSKGLYIKNGKKIYIK